MSLKRLFGLVRTLDAFTQDHFIIILLGVERSFIEQLTAIIKKKLMLSFSILMLSQITQVAAA